MNHWTAGILDNPVSSQVVIAQLTISDGVADFVALQLQVSGWIPNTLAPRSGGWPVLQLVADTEQVGPFGSNSDGTAHVATNELEIKHTVREDQHLKQRQNSFWFFD